MDVGYVGADDLFLHPKAIWSFLTTGAFPWMVATDGGLIEWIISTCEFLSYEHRSNKRMS